MCPGAVPYWEMAEEFDAPLEEQVCYSTAVYDNCVEEVLATSARRNICLSPESYKRYVVTKRNTPSTGCAGCVHSRSSCVCGFVASTYFMSAEQVR